MIPVMIIFPDTIQLSAFLVDQEISHAEVSTKDCSLVAPLEKEDITTACSLYEGHVCLRLLACWLFAFVFRCPELFV